MAFGYWDWRLAQRWTNDNGEHGDGGEGGDQGEKPGAGGNKGNQQQKPAWAAEFGETFDPDRAWQTIQSMRNQERTLRRDLTQKEQKLAEHENAGKTELEKLTTERDTLKKRVEALEGEIRSGALRTQVAAAANAAGAYYPDDVFKLLDSDAFDVDDDGKLKNVTKLIADLKKDKPVLFQRGGGADGGAGSRNGAATGANMNDTIRRAAGRA